MAQSHPLISETVKTALCSLLTETAKTPKPPTVAQLVTKNRAIIRKVLKNGHSPDEIAAVFTPHGLTVSGTTITALLAKAAKKKAAKDKAKVNETEAALTVTAEQADAICSEWTRLAEIRKTLTKPELVAAMKTEIDAMLAASYTFEDIAALFATKGVVIAAGSLKKYHRAGSKDYAPKTERRTMPNSKELVHPESITTTVTDAAAPDLPPQLPQLADKDTVLAEEFAL